MTWCIAQVAPIGRCGLIYHATEPLEGSLVELQVCPQSQAALPIPRREVNGALI
jgi:hypothetical protein